MGAWMGVNELESYFLTINEYYENNDLIKKAIIYWIKVIFHLSNHE